MAGAKSQPVRIALLGCGTVGTGVVKLLRRHAANLERRLGAPLELVGIADRSLEPDKSIGITPALITRDSARARRTSRCRHCRRTVWRHRARAQADVAGARRGQGRRDRQQGAARRAWRGAFCGGQQNRHGDWLRGQRRRRRTDHQDACARRSPAIASVRFMASSMAPAIRS